MIFPELPGSGLILPDLTKSIHPTGFGSSTLVPKSSFTCSVREMLGERELFCVVYDVSEKKKCLDSYVRVPLTGVCRDGGLLPGAGTAA
jgi:hypothetical protein